MAAYTKLPATGDGECSTTVVSPSPSQEHLNHISDYMAGPKPNTFKRRMIDVLIAITATIALITLSQHLYHTLTFSRTILFQNGINAHYSNAARLNPRYHCGNSSTEAKSLGCIFDLSLVGWVPAPCFDPVLNQRFMDFGWRFFEDQNGTIEVPLSRIMESAGTREPFWAQHGYHITHCELAWERMHRKLMGGEEYVGLTTHLLNLEHTKHCGMMTELRDDLYALNSQILPLLNTC